MTRGLYGKGSKVLQNSKVGESIWIVAGQLGSVVGLVTLLSITTGLLDESEYGQLALLLTITQLVSSIVMGGIGAGIVRFLPIAASEDSIGSYFRDAFRLLGISTAWLVGAIFLLSILLPTVLGVGSAQLIASAGCFAVIAAWVSAMNGVFNAARRRAFAAIYLSGEVWLRVILTVTFSKCCDVSVHHLLLLYAGASFVTLGSQLLNMRRIFRYRSQKTVSGSGRDWASEMWNFGRPLVLWAPFTWLFTASDRWALAYAGDLADVGLYAVAYQIGFYPMMMLGNIFLVYFGPVVNEAAGDAKTTIQIRSMSQSTFNVAFGALICTVIASLSLFVFGQFFYDLLVDEKYHQGVELLPLLALSSGFQVCHHVLGMRISALKKTHAILIPQITSSIIFISLLFIGAELGGVRGLASSLLISSIGYFAWMYFISHIHIKKAISRIDGDGVTH